MTSEPIHSDATDIGPGAVRPGFGFAIPRALGRADDPATREAFALGLPLATCPGCRLIRFVGHGPLCGDCLTNGTPGSRFDAGTADTAEALEEPVPAAFSRPLADTKADPLVESLRPWFTGDFDEEWPGDDARLVDTVRSLIDAAVADGTSAIAPVAPDSEAEIEAADDLRNRIHDAATTAINSVYGTDDRHAHMGSRIARNVVDGERLPWRW